MTFCALRSRRIACSCFLLEEDHGKNGERRTPNSQILGSLADRKKFLAQRGLHSLPSASFLYGHSWNEN